MSIETFYHTSMERVITPVEQAYGKWLFFGGDVYWCNGLSSFFHAVEIDDSRIIEASMLWYEDDTSALAPIVADVMRVIGVDEETACDLLDESTTVDDIAGDLDMDSMDVIDNNIYMQKMTANASEALGYLGVAITDENGTSYMLPASVLEGVVGLTSEELADKEAA